MAKKKRITLPKNFQEMIDAGDIEALKAVYDQCELHAYGDRFNRWTALHYPGVPDTLVRWLVEQGLDINIADSYGRTPLFKQAGMGSTDTAKLFFELGGDIYKPDRYGNTPLHSAAYYLRTDTVRFLVEQGADIHAENDRKQTPLAYCVSVCRCGFVSEMAEVSSVLLEAGAEVTEKVKDSIRQIGEDFEFHREGFSKERLPKLETGLKKLYLLFDVEPIAKRQIHDGVSPIVVPDGFWKNQYNSLWDFLVPSSGAAKTAQGEVIRITGRVADELFRNGGGNWNNEYRKMLNALVKYFASGVALSESELAETKELVSSIHAKGDDDDRVTDRLCELSVLWVSLNPNPIPLGKLDYDR